MPKILTLTRPDDWHLHLRDGAALKAVLPASAAQFRRAVVMPNLRPPVTTVAQALAYRERILAARPAGSDFEPLMTLYLTDTLSPEEIVRAHEAGIVGVKLYPAGATTNSDAGVTDLRRSRHRRLQVRHDDRARELARGVGHHSRERGTVAHMQVPVVGAGQDQGVRGTHAADCRLHG